MGALAAREIYRYARLAGFTPDQAVTMTAVALAESGGRVTAHNTSGEDSRGLWQINVAAHGDWAAKMNLYDPMENARAAYRISNGGRDVSPWTTTHHSNNAPYLAYRSEALAAAQASGDVGNLGVWTGTPGYGHSLSAGHDAAPGPSSAVQEFLNAALGQRGDTYIFGAETKLEDANPKAFDCSELVQWAAHRAGVTVPDGAIYQYQYLAKRGATISVEEAMHTPGALLFSFDSSPSTGGSARGQHVAISLGDGRTIEARGRRYGVGSWDAGRRFNYAAVIPGLDGRGMSAEALAAGGLGSGLDSDSDGLTDPLEAKLGLSATSVDTDGDSASDLYELTTLHTDPTKADSDGDQVSDAMELLLGTNPTDPDSDQDGRLDGFDQRGNAAEATDTDGDKITDALEAVLGSNPNSVDSDGDGFTDDAEYQAYFNPADANSNPLIPGSALPAPGSALPDATDPSAMRARGVSGASSFGRDEGLDGLDDLTDLNPR